MARVVAYVPIQLKKKLDVLCINQDITVSDRVAGLVKDFVAGS